LKLQVIINPRNISSKDRAFNYGDGLFETILIKNNRPLYLNEHITRLRNGCRKLKLLIPPKSLIENSITKTIDRSKDCIVKIIYSRGFSDHGYTYDKNIIPIMYFIKKDKSNIDRKHSVTLGYSNYKLSKITYLSKIKHLNRLEQILGATFVDNKKYDNHILMDVNNNIIECISSNIFFYQHKNNKYIFDTPDLSNAGVDGIMKSVIIKFMKRKRMNFAEKTINQKDLDKYDGAFICNSISGVQYVSKIESYKFDYDTNLEKILNKFIYE